MKFPAIPRKALWIPPIFWAVLIFLASCWGGPEEEPPFWFEGFDKIIHAGIYSVLSILLFAALRFERQISLSRASVLACICTVLYGISDELHQTFVATRSAEIADLWADAAGACAAFVLAWILHRNRSMRIWIENRLKQK